MIYIQIYHNLLHIYTNSAENYVTPVIPLGLYSAFPLFTLLLLNIGELLFQFLMI